MLLDRFAPSLRAVLYPAAVLFTADAYPGLADGSITVTFRRWARPQAKAGGRYRKRDVVLEVDTLDRVPVEAITDEDARRAGEVDRDAVLDRLGRPPPGTEVWRVSFHRVPDTEPALADQAELSPDDRAELERRLDRLDAASPVGPWTRATLDLIAERPGVVSTDLAAHLGRDRPSFKADVRKLKRLGLTLSLEVGYRLSPRGEAYLSGR
jgi:hypothetical protein